MDELDIRKYIQIRFPMKAGRLAQLSVAFGGAHTLTHVVGCARKSLWLHSNKNKSKTKNTYFVRKLSFHLHRWKIHGQARYIFFWKKFLNISIVILSSLVTIWWTNSILVSESTFGIKRQEIIFILMYLCDCDNYTLKKTHIFFRVLQKNIKSYYVALIALIPKVKPVLIYSFVN